ncbi:Sulfate transport system permease protein CysW [Tatumella ptyseos]|uniref:Sulfate transport system permease protein CysW n=1 Tax=Tatumella ptyseos TaxID=82987 RepID=A0A2X5NT08_9GAMM|nr:Sulfate transport system permease protein CysW [Tatumella ptyseos]
MSDITTGSVAFKKSLPWGKYLLITVGVLLSVLILVIPLISILWEALGKGVLASLHNLEDPDMLHAIWLSVMIALITVPVNLVFGTLLAWLVSRFNFPGRQLLLTLYDIPFAMSPVVVGLLYLLFWGLMVPRGTGWMPIISRSCLHGLAWCWSVFSSAARLLSVNWFRSC